MRLGGQNVSSSEGGLLSISATLRSQAESPVNGVTAGE